MEEDIKILEDMKTWDCILPNKRQTEAIENLINKHKELVKERDGIYADYQDLGKEKLKLEETIFLMANYIVGTDKDEDICKKVGKNPFCDEFGEESKCEECVIEFFRKKAKGE